MEFPPEHYLPEWQDDEEIPEEEISWTFEYNADLGNFTDENLAIITKSLNIPDGLTEFYTKGWHQPSHIYLEYSKKANMFEAESDYTISYSDRIELKKDDSQIVLFGYVGDKIVFKIQVGELINSQHRFEFIPNKYSETA